MVEYMDTLIGKLVDGLEELGLRDDTMIIFYSDNGTDKKNSSVMNGVKIDGQKSYPIQAGIRVPLIASWPKGTPQGAISRDLIDSSDFSADSDRVRRSRSSRGMGARRSEFRRPTPGRRAPHAPRVRFCVV